MGTTLTGCSGCEWMSIGSVPHQRCATACSTRRLRLHQQQQQQQRQQQREQSHYEE